jgi:acyl carrier protein
MEIPQQELASASDPFRAALAMDLSQVQERAIAVVARCLDRKPGEVKLKSTLWGDLDAESLDMLDIVYSLERTFIIRMPRLNILQRATDLFGESTIVQGAILTPTGLAILKASMPEVPASFFQPICGLTTFARGFRLSRLCAWCSVVWGPTRLCVALLARASRSRFRIPRWRFDAHSAGRKWYCPPATSW